MKNTIKLPTEECYDVMMEQKNCNQSIEEYEKLLFING